MSESKFDKRLELRRKHCPPGLVDALVFVNDPWEFADSIADDLFGEVFTVARLSSFSDSIWTVRLLVRSKEATPTEVISSPFNYLDKNLWLKVFSSSR
jgi:hypothetical protein